MKQLLSALVILFSVSAFAQTSVAPDSAKYFEGSLVKVCGKVFGTHTGKTGIVKFEFGGKYPNNTFTAVIFSENTSKFEPAENYDGKEICVTGRIKIYKEKPEIELTNPNQLKDH